MTKWHQTWKVHILVITYKIGSLIIEIFKLLNN